MTDLVLTVNYKSEIWEANLKCNIMVFRFFIR